MKITVRSYIAVDVTVDVPDLDPRPTRAAEDRATVVLDQRLQDLDYEFTQDCECRDDQGSELEIS